MLFLSLSLYVYIEHSLFCCMACLSYHVVWWLRLVLSPCVELILSILSSCLLLSQFMHQYANMTGVYWWDPCYHSSTMDPSWVMIHDVLDVRPHLLRIGGSSPKEVRPKVGTCPGGIAAWPLPGRRRRISSPWSPKLKWPWAGHQGDFLDEKRLSTTLW